MKKASEDAWDLSVSENNGVIKIDTEVFNHLPAALTYRILKRGLETVKGSSENISQIHLESMLALARNISGSSINLPGKITATKLYKVLIIHKSNSIMTTLPAISSKTKLLIPGVTVIPGWRIVATLDKAPRNYVDNKKELGGLAWLNINVAENISVRKREPGDIFQPTGMKNSRKIQDFMIDKKIPKDCRDRIPILETDKGIAWIVGWRTANWTIPTPGNESLKVKFKRITE
jgi:tRNA(Ile)-lysidine synthase